MPMVKWSQVASSQWNDSWLVLSLMAIKTCCSERILRANQNIWAQLLQTRLRSRACYLISSNLVHGEKFSTSRLIILIKSSIFFKARPGITTWMAQWLWYPDPCQKIRWPIWENIKIIYGIKSDVFHPFIKVRLRREQDLTKKPMVTAREALQVPPKWNEWSSRKLSLESAGDCHLSQSNSSWRRFLER